MVCVLFLLFIYNKFLGNERIKLDTQVLLKFLGRVQAEIIINLNRKVREKGVIGDIEMCAPGLTQTPQNPREALEPWGGAGRPFVVTALNPLAPSSPVRANGPSRWEDKRSVENFS